MTARYFQNLGEDADIQEQEAFRSKKQTRSEENLHILQLKSKGYRRKK